MSDASLERTVRAEIAEGERPDRPIRRVLRSVRAWVSRHPRLDVAYRAAVGVFGGVLTVGGLLLVPLPGPGWLVVFLGLTVLGWRAVPTNADRADIGASARAAMPTFRQIFVSSPGGQTGLDLDRLLVLAEPHNRAFAEGAFDLRQGGVERLGLVHGRSFHEAEIRLAHGLRLLLARAGRIGQSPPYGSIVRDLF